ncbi:RNA-guided endonuclease InsQ/TnpB family protein [Paractinoplanes atraurantiacus]|uniref:Putative transposase n=1 Tax=Paractinoplanes atraurantiacus TaxID=1036182 RepID=A0A285KJ28_9ACTN|nr:RNA-guided endonuclease TnpB family protein [Actinoplanes atraurantiacus]SNY72605.1 putative transposase [Actinoplanes atraurantiacus]
MVHRTARTGLRLTHAQRQRCFGLLRSAGDVWSCALEINGWRRRRGDAPAAGYQELCRLLAQSGPGTFGELDSTGARSVLRRYSDAWFSAAARRKAGAVEVRFPRRRRSLMPIRWYHGTFGLEGCRVRLPVARGYPPLLLRLARLVPYPAATVRSVTLLFADGRLWIDVTAELPVATYPADQQPDPDRVAGVDLGIIHPFAVATRDGHALLVSGRAIRAEHRLHLADTKGRRRATARRAPSKGQRGSRRWRKTRRRARLIGGRHRRRTRQALHEAAKTVVGWAVDHRIGTLTVGDPRDVLDVQAGRRHNLRLRQWQIGRTLQILQDKAALAGIRVHLVDERGTSSTCPHCGKKITKPSGRTMACRHCQFAGHRDLATAFTIAARTPGSAITTCTPIAAQVVTHRRAGRRLPGVATARRDPRRPPPRAAAGGSVGRRRPAPPLISGRESLAHTRGRGSTTSPDLNR